ncbi:MAG: 2-C-methyl-D-erythritol 2,4-cyclodiphosphate synthase [Bacteroidia bacterium]|nr:MAG: 2-C-methyl-D-erythritol 2,4-cyclodiphosphate synthase [Bacteroidia bacterium]
MIRVGYGFDIHRLVEGLPLKIGGVKIHYHKGLLGHSDADVLLHAIIDALIGAVALGDIGKYFPDYDDDYKDLDSRIMLRKIIKKIKNDLGYQVGNIDATIVMEKPKLRDYIDLMRVNVADDLEVDVDQINIKAKTNEQVGAIGKSEAVECHVVVLLQK